MLATEEEPIFVWNSNTGRNLRRRKLLVGEKVEVRSVEEGFLGSWHLGTVISSKKRRRRSIRYENILSDDGADSLVETVDVSEVIEGLSSSAVSDTLRGRLRPVPPELEVDRFNLPYGLCVDVFISEAWWEGVLFDHENGSEERKVFFPELGDETNAALQSLRITQDWNEVTETWECRARWLFLELIEKYKEDNYLPISVKQLWYDMRDRVAFARIQEWTCSTRHLWEDLMLGVIDDYLEITINQLLLDYDAERYQHQEFMLLKEASQAVNETDACPTSMVVFAPQEQQVSSIDKDHKRGSHRYMSMSVLTSVSGIRSEESCINGVTEFSSQKSIADHKRMMLHRKPGNWQPFDCVAKSCPQAVSSYIRTTSKKVAIHVKKHLKYMGWTIEQMVDEGGRQRFRYLSPDGRLTEQSLRQVCFILKRRDEPLTPPEVAKPLSMPCENWTYNTQEIVLALPAYNRSAALGDGRTRSAESLLECETQGKEEVVNAGSCNFYPRNSFPAHERTLRIRLESKTKAQGFVRLESTLKQKPKLRSNSKKNEMIKGSRNVNLSRRKGQTSRMLMDIKNRVTGRGKTRVSRSSKRVQRVITPISRNQSPRSVLSWLIDNNVILPRENIRCRDQKDHTVRKEGKLTRVGIKCSCCRRIFTISGFELHAEGGSCRAANMFLDDGRSLLECQVEAYKTRKKAQPPDLLKMKLRQGENDIVCSVCHYGGKLILCDGCPSAFHANCLELEDVPDGDWFCASCCCDACGQFLVKNTSKYAKEEKLISCKQCELKYHPSCLQYDGAGDSLDTFLGEKWFCSKDCEEIFGSLCELVGKPREVGVEKKLTWRLMQSLEPDTAGTDTSNGTDTSKIETVAENYCKLSVALDVMHELFEPLKRPHGGGDLAEDVIFSRWSKYKRMNFSGFYTVVLERNDELVTVATVRILGRKVAEMPFIGTRFQHRQLGMCRVLINELEKVLNYLGVERLVLPAVPSVLNTWTNSFGFSKMTILEKKDFLRYTFLEFGRTILCQKILIKSSVADPIPSTVSLGETHCDIIRIEDNFASDDRSEVQQAEQNIRIENRSASDERTEVHQVEQNIRIEDNSASNDRSEVHHAEQHLEESSSTKNPPEEINTHQERLVKENRILKCYTRRRLKCMRLT